MFVQKRNINPLNLCKMVIGKGLLAKAFKQYENDDEVIIFASGVSNSKEISESEFEREENLLKSISNKDALLVYFGTCSVYDPTVQMSRYVRHKMHMERLVSLYFHKSIVFRLPIIVGHTNNPNTFFNFIKEQIEKGNSIPVHFSASRHLVDIDDLALLLPGIIETYKGVKNLEKFKKKIEVSFNNGIMVLDIVKMMLDIMNKKNDIEIIYGGCDYDFPKKDFSDYLKSINYQLPENYTYNLLKKYLL